MSHAAMHDKPQSFTRVLIPSPRRCLFAALSTSLAIATTGCLGTLNKHSVALADATAPVIDEASATYRNVQSLHNRSVDTDAVTQFDQASPVYNPRSLKPLLTETDIQVRLAVLLALQCYVKTLVEITSGTSSPALDAASKSVANSLASLGNDVAPSFGIPPATTSDTVTQTVATAGTSTTATITTTSAAKTISPAVQAGLGTAVNALGQFLVYRTIRKELPSKIVAMDPHVQELCKDFLVDVATLQSQEKLDYDNIIDGQTLFIRQNGGNAHPALEPEQRRLLIMQLPGIVRQQHDTEDGLAQLKASLTKLAFVHHELAAEAQGNHPGSMTNTIADLSAAGDNLGRFYSSVSAK